MTRREAIKNTALMLGYTATAPMVIAALNGCQASGEPGWMPKFLTEEQGYTIAEAAERILPATDTPGAKDVFVHEFIDIVLKDYMPVEEREKFMTGLAEMEKQAVALGGAFADLEEAQQIDVLKVMEVADHAARKVDDEDHNDFFTQLKGLVMMGYFTSEKVGTEILAYEPVPGPYQGCIPLSETSGKTWSL